MRNLRSINESVYGNPHSALVYWLMKKGIDFKFRFLDKDNHTPASEAMQKLYDKISDMLFPFLSNTMFRAVENGKEDYIWLTKGVDDKIDQEEVKKWIGKTVYAKPLPTIGRFDINYSNTHNMTPAQKAKAKEIYKGKNNTEYHFYFADGAEVNIIISKSGKLFTLAHEDGKTYLPKLFVKIPKWETLYLKEGWVKEDRLIEILKQMDAKVAPLYKSQRLRRLGDDLGIFDK